MVVVIKIEKKMKEEDVFDSSGRCETKKLVSMHLKLKREIGHFTLSSMGIYLVECTLYCPRWPPAKMAAHGTMLISLFTLESVNMGGF